MTTNPNRTHLRSADGHEVLIPRCGNCAHWENGCVAPIPISVKWSAKLSDPTWIAIECPCYEQAEESKP